MLFRGMRGGVVYFLHHRVIRVSDKFGVDTSTLFDRSHCSSELINSRRCEAAVSGLGRCLKMVISFAYKRISVRLVGSGNVMPGRIEECRR